MPAASRSGLGVGPLADGGGRAELRGSRQWPAGESRKAHQSKPFRLARRVQDRQVMNAQRWYALAVMLAAVFLAAFDFNVVTIAIPSIQRGLGTSFGEIQLIVAAYARSFAVVLITGGRLGEDRKSTRLNSSHSQISYAVF